jgi:hypothetical protein
MGSCFAAYISKYLLANGYNYVRSEKTMYDVFSANWGIVVSPPAIRQILQYSLTGKFAPLESIWTYRGMLIDPYRRGMCMDRVSDSSVLDFTAKRASHRIKSREALTESKVFVFTLGLSEVWYDRRDNSVFSMVPFDLQEHHGFKLLSVDEVYGDLQQIYDMMRMYNPNCRLVFTVSPIPLKATFRNDVDIVSANCESKAILRAAVGKLRKNNPMVEYFPSYEFVIHAMPFFLKDNRHPKPEVVDTMMKFFVHLYAKEA